uniref:Uncharacterized protein n=1 Tax=Amphimedon queenslandica TaxID=400682 RepID=A0A1X7TG89_AMPQE
MFLLHYLPLANKSKMKNPAVHLVCMIWSLLMESVHIILTVIWEHCVVQEEDGQDYLDMSDSTVNCPSGFRLYQSGGVRACGRATSSGGSCTLVQFPSNGISYSQVCGRVTGYQYGSPDAVQDYHGSNRNNLNADYVDGVSITHGSPRQHVWSLLAGIHEFDTNSAHNCPCATGSTQQVQSFIGDHYFCESAATSSWQYQLYTSDPLWDGQSCGSLESPCCNVT